MAHRGDGEGEGEGYSDEPGANAGREGGAVAENARNGWNGARDIPPVERNMSEDELLASRLQAEEEQAAELERVKQRARENRGGKGVKMDAVDADEAYARELQMAEQNGGKAGERDPDGQRGVEHSDDVRLALELQEEEVKTAKLRSQMGNRWPRDGDEMFYSFEVASAEEGLAVEVDGRVVLLADLPWYKRPIAMCLPCLIGNPCSGRRLLRYAKVWFGTFIGVCSIAQIVLLILMLVKSGFAPTSENPMYGPDTETLHYYGSTSKQVYLNDEWWRLITAVFLHAGIIHLVCNVIAQMRCGVSWERAWGLLSTAYLYVTGGIVGNVTSMLCYPRRSTVGSSGAFLALFGAKCGHIYITWEQTDPKERRFNIIQLFIFAASLILIGAFVENVDNCAHFGGWIVGFLAAFSMFQDDYGEGSRITKKLCLVFSKVLLMGYIVGTAIFLYLDHRNDPRE